MGTVRKRGEETYQGIVRKKEGGVLVFSEYRTFDGHRAEPLARDWVRKREKTIAQNGVPHCMLETTTLGALLRQHKLALLASTEEMSRSKASELERLADEFDWLRLSELRPKAFTDFATRRRTAGAGPASVLHNLSTVRSVLSIAKAMYGYEVNADTVKEAMTALSKLKIISKGKRRTRRPSPEELSQLNDYFAAQEGHPLQLLPMRQIMWLAIELPRRVSELTAMLWANLNANVVLLRDTKHPTEPRDETVPVLPRAAAILAQLSRTDARILPYNPESISMSFRRACRRLGIADLHFHDLRREGISRMFEAGYTIPEVAKVSGHLDWSMLKIYTEIRPQAVLDRFA
jgi:integrase